METGVAASLMVDGDAIKQDNGCCMEKRETWSSKKGLSMTDGE